MENIYISSTEFCDRIVEKHFKNADIISLDDIIYKFEELSDALDDLQEKFDDYKQEVNDNYKFVGQAEQIGYNENW